MYFCVSAKKSRKLEMLKLFYMYIDIRMYTNNIVNIQDDIILVSDIMFNKSKLLKPCHGYQEITQVKIRKEFYLIVIQ